MTSLYNNVQCVLNKYLRQRHTVSRLIAVGLMLPLSLHAEDLPDGFLPASPVSPVSARVATSPSPTPSDADKDRAIHPEDPTPSPPVLTPSAPLEGKEQNMVPNSTRRPAPHLNPLEHPPVPGRMSEGGREGDAETDVDVPGAGRIGHAGLPPAVDGSTENAYGASSPQKMYANPPSDYGNDGPKGTPDEEAFEKTIKQLAPMNADQIRKERSHMDTVERVQSEPANGVIPTPHSGTISLSLKPGEASPRIGLAAGNATVLTFYDQTGAPWPITSVTSGNSDAFTSSKAGQVGKTNMAVIAPKANYGYGNLVVTLEGLPVPVIFSVVCGSGVVDYRKDIRIRGRGPNAQENITEGSSLQPTNDKTMNDFVDDLPPKGAVSIKTNNPEVEAWRYKHGIYVRSRLQMVDPDWIDDQKSPEGDRVYEIDENTLQGSPILEFLIDGRSVYVDLDINMQ